MNQEVIDKSFDSEIQTIADKLFIRKFNILCYAYNKFGDMLKVERWLNSSIEGLGKTPLELIEDDENYSKLTEIMKKEKE